MSASSLMSNLLRMVWVSLPQPTAEARNGGSARWKADVRPRPPVEKGNRDCSWLLASSLTLAHRERALTTSLSYSRRRSSSLKQHAVRKKYNKLGRLKQFLSRKSAWWPSTFSRKSRMLSSSCLFPVRSVLLASSPIGAPSMTRSFRSVTSIFGQIRLKSDEIEAFRLSSGQPRKTSSH